MSTLENAPLVEVMLEIFWEVKVDYDYNNLQYLIGDLFTEIKNKYPVRNAVYDSTIPPMELLTHRPLHRYRKLKDGYPLIQIGPGLITVNTVNQNYDWDTFKIEIEFVIDALSRLDTFGIDKVKTRLTYFDFVKDNFEKDNRIEYLANKMNFELNQNIITDKSKTKAFNFNIAFQYENNTINYILKDRKIDDELGVWLEYAVTSDSELKFNKISILKWAEKAHDKCRDIFYKTFDGILLKQFGE